MEEKHIYEGKTSTEAIEKGLNELKKEVESSSKSAGQEIDKAAEMFAQAGNIFLAYLKD